MVENGEWVVYRKKRRLIGKELPFTVVTDNNGDCWIVQFKNLKHIEPQADKSFELVIPKFIKGIIPAKDIFYPVLDTKTQRVVLKVINPNFQRMKNTHLSNREAINLGDLEEELRGDLSPREEFTPELSIRHLIINGNNIKLQGQLEKIDLSVLKINKLESMTDVFAQCRKLEEIKLPRIEIDHRAQMHNTFKDCINLKEVNTEQITIHNEQSRAHIELKLTFVNCREIKKIDLSNIEYTDIIKFEHVFMDCKRLEIVEFKPTLNKLVKKQEFRRLLTEKGIQNTAIFLGDTIEFRV